MYKAGDLIAVNGEIFEYFKYDEVVKLHLVYEVDIDCEGKLTASGIMCYFYTEELTHNEVNFTKQQWYGIVEHFIRQDYEDLTEEEITDATEDIVGRCFAYGIPKFHELADYIAEYMNR